MKKESARTALHTRLTHELEEPVAAPIGILASQLAARAGGGAGAVLFYGSGLRDDTLDGVLDFYVLVDHCADWPASRLATWANGVLPPNVGWLETVVEGRRLRAKVAVMTTAQFEAGLRGEAIDTTLWARFSQPSRLVHVRGPEDRAWVVDAICTATVTAARWSAVLGPDRGAPEAFWRALYARTYAAELRVESSGRGDDLVRRDASRYEALLPLAWDAGGIDYDTSAQAEGIRPLIADAERAQARRRWSRRERWGRPLNVLRLLKAACTFDNAADYAAWKVERHTGVRLELSHWQRRHPLLAAPGVYFRLRRQGLLR
ncbi:MAG: hypothetical protein ACREUE_05030 [Panacagrimonas sp.]